MPLLSFSQVRLTTVQQRHFLENDSALYKCSLIIIIIIIIINGGVVR